MSDLVYQRVGSAVAQWHDDSPLRWTMHEPERKGGLVIDPIEIDLRPLQAGYDDAFLAALKDVLVTSRHRKELATIATQAHGLSLLFQRVHAIGFDGTTRIQRVDHAFLAVLAVYANDIPAVYLNGLKTLHAQHPADERIFERGLLPGDFPGHSSKRGATGDIIHRILGQALHRATLVHVLDVAEAAFEEGVLSLGRYAFLRLALNIFCRPASYRRLTLGDLRVDKNRETGAVSYFLDVLPAKSRVHNPRKIAHLLHPDVGQLLAMQREAITNGYGHLAPMTDSGIDVGRLVLFPATRLTDDRSSWTSAYANANVGMLDRNSFTANYLRPIKELARTRLSFNALRHTIGTQLAAMGCSATTIQAVLKHANDSFAQAYVDIAFDSLMDDLSDSLQPSFEQHFPIFKDFVSKKDPIPAERRIESSDLETGRVEVTAICGRHVACEHAPISCYACHRFTPCYDADHSINLDVVNREIEASERLGSAMRHDVLRWKTIRNHIRIVIDACAHKRRALEAQLEPRAGTEP